MTLPRALALISALVLAGLSDAIAQFPPPPGQSAPASSNPFPPPPGQAAPASSSPFPPAPGQPRQQSSPFPPPGSGPSAVPPPSGQAARPPVQPGGFPPPGGPQAVCQEFPALRTQAEKDAAAIKAAGDRKASREEVCAAFTKFAASEGKMTKFLETNQTVCGVPPDAIKQVKTQHAKTLQFRKNICTAGPTPRAPSLSDALSGPALPTEAPKPGRGTFDTLTGSPLAR